MPMFSTSIRPDRRKRINQQIPEKCGEPVPLDHQRGKILSLPVLGGLHHDYREIRLIAEGCAKEERFPLRTLASSVLRFPRRRSSKAGGS